MADSPLQWRTGVVNLITFSVFHFLPPLLVCPVVDITYNKGSGGFPWSAAGPGDILTEWPEACCVKVCCLFVATQMGSIIVESQPASSCISLSESMKDTSEGECLLKAIVCHYSQR